MNKKKALKYLEDLEENLIKQRIANEVDNRAIDYMIMSGETNDQVLAKRTTLGKGAKYLDTQINKIRGLMMDVNEGKFDI